MLLAEELMDGQDIRIRRLVPLTSFVDESN